MFFGLSNIKKKFKRAIRAVQGVSEPVEYNPDQVSEKLEIAEEDKVAEYRSKYDKGEDTGTDITYSSRKSKTPRYRKRKRVTYLPAT